MFRGRLFTSFLRRATNVRLSRKCLTTVITRNRFENGRNPMIYGACGVGFLVYCAQENPDSSKPVDMKKERAVVERLDALYSAYLIEQAVMACERYLGLNSPHIQWRIARIYCEHAKMTQDKNKRKEFMMKGWKHVQIARDMENKDEPIFAVHKWYAILLNYVAEYEGTKARLTKAPIVKLALEEALKINPEDATTWHILGVWHYSFADLPGYQRTLASYIFAEPPKSTYEQALEIFLKAEDLDPGFYMQNMVYIAKCYKALGDLGKAKDCLIKASSQMVISADDGLAFKEAQDLLKGLGINRDKEE